MRTIKRFSRWSVLSIGAVSLLVGLVAGTSLSTTLAGPSGSTTTATPAAAITIDGDLTSGRLSFAPVVQAALPAVVNISAAKVVATANEPPAFADPFFRDFFGDRWERQFRVPRERRERSLGSGVIVSADGHILTNNHVVEGAEEISISLADDRELDATLVGTDPRTDIALLKVEAQDLPWLELGDSSKVEVGDIVLAIGNPFGVGQTVTMGIVGAVGRGNLGIVDYEDFIQTDASINPGNSGGALISARGELIGINTAIVSRGAQGNQGVGFAVPIAMARHVMDQLLEHGRVVRGWLGVTIQELSPELVRAFELEQSQGALVSEVTPDGPAARAGLEPGDVIVAIDSEPVRDIRALRLRIASAMPGSVIELEVIRDGRERELRVELDALDDASETTGPASENAGPLDDIEVRDLTPELRRELRLPDSVTGALVTAVSGDGGQGGGLLRGDVITAVNRNRVRSADEFRRAVASAGSDELLLRVHRRGSNLFVVWKRR